MDYYYLNIQTLESRRGVFDACFLHGIINGLIDTPNLLSKLTFMVPSSSRTTRSQITLYIQGSDVNNKYESQSPNKNDDGGS